MSAAPPLEAPGAGLPAHHLLLARLALPVFCLSSWERAQRRFDEEGVRILALCGGLSEDRLTRKVLVSGVFGIEDSSRFWSAAMALEHLIKVNGLIADILETLGGGGRVGFELLIKDVKPTGALGAGTPAAFADSLAAHRARFLDPRIDRRASGRFKHPWFGPLTARQWQCFAPVHQRIHRRQLEAILRGL